MNTTPVPYPTDTILHLRNLLQTSIAPTTAKEKSKAAKEKSKAAKRKPPIFIASASHEGTCMILDTIDGMFRLTMLWGTNTPENADNPDEGQFIEFADGITYEELDAHALDGFYLFRKGKNWELEANVGDVFAEFVFTPQGREQITLSVSIHILHTMDAA